MSFGRPENPMIMWFMSIFREWWFKSSKIEKNHEKMKTKMEKSLFQNLFMVDLWVLGSRFQPFRNVSDHFWSTSGRFRLSRINYKQIFKKWKFRFFSSKISSLIRIPELRIFRFETKIQPQITTLIFVMAARREFSFLIDCRSLQNKSHKSGISFVLVRFPRFCYRFWRVLES